VYPDERDARFVTSRQRESSDQPQAKHGHEPNVNEKNVEEKESPLEMGNYN
jgi:hypothetical protein